MIHPKVFGSVFMAALAASVITILRKSGVPVDGGLSDAITAFAAGVGGYSMPSPAPLVRPVPDSELTGMPADDPPLATAASIAAGVGG